MKLNTNKCNQLSITRQRNPKETSYELENKTLKKVDHHPYLGVELSSDLKWHKHIEIITSKATKSLNFVRRHLYNCDSKLKYLLICNVNQYIFNTSVI